MNINLLYEGGITQPAHIPEHTPFWIIFVPIILGLGLIYIIVMVYFGRKAKDTIIERLDEKKFKDQDKKIELWEYQQKGKREAIINMLKAKVDLNITTAKEVVKEYNKLNKIDDQSTMLIMKILNDLRDDTLTDLEKAKL